MNHSEIDKWMEVPASFMAGVAPLREALIKHLPDLDTRISACPDLKLKDLFASKGIKDAEVIRIAIDRLAPNNTFDREPAPWIVSGRIEKD